MRRLCLVLLVILGHQTLAKHWKKQQLPSLNSEPEKNLSGQVMENQTEKTEKSLLNYPAGEDFNAVLSKKCSGKPDAPEHATVHCFKKRNTCRATCRSGYIFSKKGSKFAIYDCQGDNWVMRDGEDKCHRNESTLILNSKTDTNTSRNHAPIDGSNAPRRKEVKCVYPEGHYFDYDYDYDYDYDDNQKSKSVNKNSLDHASSNIKLNQIKNNHIKNQKITSKSKNQIKSNQLKSNQIKSNQNQNQSNQSSKNQIKIKKSNHMKSNQIKSNNERKTHQRKKMSCIIPAQNHGHDNYSCHSHYYYYDEYYDDYYHDLAHDYGHLYYDYYGGYYLCKGTQYCIVDYLVCDNIVDCPDGDDELDCYKAPTTPTVTPSISSNKCPPGWSLVSEQCFQVNLFTDGHSFHDALKTCYSNGGTIAHPNNIIAANDFIQGQLSAMLGQVKDRYWFGGQETTGGVEWLVGGGAIPKDQLLVGHPREDPSYCLEIQLKLDSHNNVNIDFSQHLNINSNSEQVGDIEFHSDLVIHPKNANDEATHSNNDCIEPDGYICAREPLP